MDRVPAEFSGIIVVRKTPIMTWIVHGRCLILTEKKSHRENTRTGSVAAAAAAATRKEDREGTEKETRSRDYGSHHRSTVLL